MSNPQELVEQLTSSLKELIEEMYEDEGIKVDEFLFDPEWVRKGQVIAGRFRGEDGNTYQFKKTANGIELAQETE